MSPEGALGAGSGDGQVARGSAGPQPPWPVEQLPPGVGSPVPARDHAGGGRQSSPAAGTRKATWGPGGDARGGGGQW